MGQGIFRQEIFKGSVSVFGFSLGSSVLQEEFNINWSQNSMIKEIYLITYSSIDNYDFNPNFDFVINNQLVHIDKKCEVSFVKNSFLQPTIEGSIGYKIYFKDLKTIVNLNDTNFTIYQKPPTNIPSSCPGCFVSGFSIIIIYENPTMNAVCFQQMLNANSESWEKNMNLNVTNLLNQNLDVGLGIMTDKLAQDANDGYNFYINNSNIGLLNVPDAPLYSSGVMGSFNYTNGILNGIYDDNPNLIINGANGIMKLNNYLPFQEINLKVEYLPPITNFFHNILLGYNLVYSTPCEPFEVSAPRDTTLCQGANLSLQASGGQRYKWLPETGLSCYDCANPTFTADTTTFYSLQIFSSDSCSVIRTVRLFVEEPKTVSAQSTNASFCGGATGSVIMQSNPFYNRYSVDGVLFPVGTTLSNLSSGLHQIVGVSETGCSSVPITVTVDSINTTVADFWRTPLEGPSPLNVSIENKSQQANNFLWQVDTLFYQNIPNPYTFIEPGWHTITLYAWKYDTLCADTVSKTVFVRIPQIIPTAFTPNNDGDNDVWELPYIDILFPENQVFVYNRWGNLLYTSKKGAYATQAWDGNFEGKPLPVGSYFYVIEFNDEDYPKATGQVSVIRK